MRLAHGHLIGRVPFPPPWSWDSPDANLPLVFPFPNPQGAISKTLVNETFHDYVVAITTDPRAFTEPFYSVHADAIWEFDGTGNVAPLPNLPIWTPTTAGVRVVRGWSPVVPWTEPPHV